MSDTGSDGNKWPHTVDPEVWARKFVENTKPDEALNEAHLTSWFSSAIMAGFEHGRIKLREQV